MGKQDVLHFFFLHFLLYFVVFKGSEKYRAWSLCCISRRKLSFSCIQLPIIWGWVIVWWSAWPVYRFYGETSKFCDGRKQEIKEKRWMLRCKKNGIVNDIFSLNSTVTLRKKKGLFIHNSSQRTLIGTWQERNSTSAMVII